MADTATLDSIVLDVNVFLEAAPVTQEGFGVLLIAGPNAGFAERLRYYETAAAILADEDAGLTSSDPEYIAAVAAFAAGMDRLAIGRAALSVAEVQTVTIATPAVGDWTLTIDGTAYDYTAGGGDTAADVGDGLRAAAAAETGVTLGGTGATITLTSVQRGLAHTITVTPAAGGAGSVAETTPNVSLADELAAIYAEDAGWYGIVTVSASTCANHTDDIENVAAWVETVRRLYVAQSADSAVGTSASTDVASLVKASSYKHTAIAWHTDSSEPFAAGWAASRLVIDPDDNSTTWAHATLSGVATDVMSTTQRGYATGKNANVYLTLKNVGSSWPGTVASGHFVDEIVISHWFAARIEEAIAQLFLNASNQGRKIPHTAEGYALFAAEIRGVHQVGVSAGHFVTDEDDLVITTPTATSAQRAAREYTISCTCTLAGAVHSITVNAYVAR